MTTCSARVEGVHEDCCLHEVPKGSKHFPGQVCCFCGDFYLTGTDPQEAHGMYEPSISRIERKQRAVISRKEEWLKEQERKKYREDYGLEPYF